MYKNQNCAVLPWFWGRNMVKTTDARRRQALSEAELLVPDCGIYSRLWHRIVVPPASLCRQVGRYDNPMPESTIYSSSQGLRIWPLDSFYIKKTSGQTYEDD